MKRSDPNRVDSNEYETESQPQEAKSNEEYRISLHFLSALVFLLVSCLFREAQPEDVEETVLVERHAPLVESYHRGEIGGFPVTVEDRPPMSAEVTGEAENVSENASDHQTGGQVSKREEDQTTLGVESTIEIENGKADETDSTSAGATAGVVSGEQEEGEIASLEEFKRKKMQEEEKNKRMTRI